MTILEVDQFGRYPDDGDDLAAFLDDTKGDAYRSHVLTDVPETRTPHRPTWMEPAAKGVNGRRRA